jgi:hypothetical protein
MLALVQTAGLVGAHLSLEAPLRQLLLEKALQLRLSFGIAASSGMAGFPLVAADKDVPLKLGHENNVADFLAKGVTLVGRDQCPWKVWSKLV